MYEFLQKGNLPHALSAAVLPDNRDFTEKRYHKPSDEYDPKWDMKAAVADADALLEVGLRVANGDKWPEWKPNAGFSRQLR